MLENAVKFSPENKAVMIEVQQVNENEIEIAITDKGQGIPEGERERILTCFIPCSAVTAGNMVQAWA